MVSVKFVAKLNDAELQYWKTAGCSLPAYISQTAVHIIRNSPGLVKTTCLGSHGLIRWWFTFHGSRRQLLHPYMGLKQLSMLLTLPLVLVFVSELHRFQLSPVHRTGSLLFFINLFLFYICSGNTVHSRRRKKERAKLKRNKIAYDPTMQRQILIVF